MFQFPQLQHLRDGHAPRLPIPQCNSPMPNLSVPQPQIPTLINPCQPIPRHPGSLPGSPHPIWAVQQTSSSHCVSVPSSQAPLSTNAEQHVPHEVYVHATPKMHSKEPGMNENENCANQKLVSQSNPVMNVNLTQGVPVNVFWDKQAADVHKHAMCGIDEHNDKIDHRMTIEQSIGRMVERFTTIKQECGTPTNGKEMSSTPSTMSDGIEDAAKMAYSKAATDLLMNIGSEAVLCKALDPASQFSRNLFSKNIQVSESNKIDMVASDAYVGEEKKQLDKNEHLTKKSRWHCPYDDSMPKTHADQLSLKRTGQDVSEASSGKTCDAGNMNCEDSNLIVKLKLKNPAETTGKESAGCRIKQFCCKTCGKTFAKSEKLRIHQQIHSDEKLYECTDCEWAFRRREHLIRHMMTHTGEMPYECKTCGHKFRRNEHLKRHQLVHTGETPYQCTRCDKQFKRSERLRRHMSTHFTALVSPK